eukprot:1610908-Rhodomonas_salina.2
MLERFSSDLGSGGVEAARVMAAPIKTKLRMRDKVNPAAPTVFNVSVTPAAVPDAMRCRCGAPCRKLCRLQPQTHSHRRSSNCKC